MKHLKRFWAALICLFMVFLVFITPIGTSNSDQISSISRPYVQSDIIIIDSNPVPLTGKLTESSIEIKTLKQINDIRITNDLPALAYSEGLVSTAMTRAKECADSFSHTRPNGSDWWTVNSQIMYGENLAQGYSTAESVTDAWMNSPAHKDLIMADDFRSCGIGHYEINGQIYIACEFGY